MEIVFDRRQRDIDDRGIHPRQQQAHAADAQDQVWMAWPQLR
jgi:hypothetical protein